MSSVARYKPGDVVRLVRVDEVAWRADGELEWEIEATAAAIGRYARVVAIQPDNVRWLDVDGLFSPDADFEDAHAWGVAVDEVEPATEEEYLYQRAMDELTS